MTETSSRPVSGILVSGVSQDGRERDAYYTDERGRYTLTLPVIVWEGATNTIPNPYRIVPRVEDIGTCEPDMIKNIYVAENLLHPNSYHFLLTRQNATISGRALYSDGSPVRTGVLLMATTYQITKDNRFSYNRRTSSNDWYTAITDNNGRYEFRVKLGSGTEGKITYYVSGFYKGAVFEQTSVNLSKVNPQMTINLSFNKCEE